MEEGPAIEGWVVLASQVPTCLGQAPPQPHDGPGNSTLEGLGKAGGQGLGCLSVCLSLLTIEPNHCFQD